MNNIVHFVRWIKKQKSTALLSVFSLSLGIAVSLLIVLGVWEEYGFDRFHRDGSQIYRLIAEGRDQTFASSFRQFGDAAQEVIPEIKAVCRLRRNEINLRLEKQFIAGEGTVETDDNFFTFFTFPLKYGDPETCLLEKNSLVISESLSKRLFKEEEALGKSVIDGEGKVWKVTAVMYDFPYTSHIQTEIVTPFTGRASRRDCGGDIFTTYLKIPSIADREQLEKEIISLNHNQNNEMKELGLVYHLEALEDIHFSTVPSDHQGNKNGVGILMIAAVIILIIACINFVNLFISTSFLRSHEVGVRKTMGASRRDLVGYFYLETLYYTLLALGIGILFAWLALPLFNELTGYQLILSFDNGRLYLVAGILVVVIVLGAGFFPAFYMTRYNIIDTLYRRFKGKALSLLREILLVVQFTFSIAFLLALFFVQDQVDYMIHYNIGLDKEQVICFYPGPAMRDHYQTAKGELLKCPAISQVCMKNALPTSWADGFPVQKNGGRERIPVELCEVEYNYFDFMSMQFVEGEEPFTERMAGPYVVLNETAVRQLELKEPINAVINFWNNDWVVKGVVKDVLDKGLKEKVMAQVYYPMFRVMEMSDYVIMCKVAGRAAEAIDAVRKQWDTYHPDYPFKYQFLDEVYAELYRNEQRLEKVFTCAMFVMMLISITGLFAMAYFMMQCRVKEIGIRKVNGATVKNLLLLLNVDLIKWVVLAWLIACGIVWYFMDYWLKNFVQRIELGEGKFLLAGVIAVVVALVTVSALTWKAARLNPVDSLRSE